jgi:glucose-6-phosphate dehydrogenase assembly protein OpcA
MTHSCQLEDFRRQVFEHSGDIDSRLSTNTHLVLRVVLQETLDTTAGELNKRGALVPWWKRNEGGVMCDASATGPGDVVRKAMAPSLRASG